MSSHTVTTDDVVKAGMAVARDAAEGRLDPATLTAEFAAEARELFGRVIGPKDALWPLQVDVARQVLGLAGIGGDELSEWTAVARLREGTTEPEPVADVIEIDPGTTEPGPAEAAPATSADRLRAVLAADDLAAQTSGPRVPPELRAQIERRVAELGTET
ncbi:hypothetical protein [Williamsia herbipolensis]|uniref:hypothetical protein n=1 Tax=Williamsia herbipolensis TaxID=1603258 RepID=UPI000696529F|nr:hypothetical protein [Williamsia herbipolensis]